MTDVANDPILRRDQDLLRKVLDRDARELIAGRSFPLALEHILDELGIELAAEPGERLGKAHGYLCERDARWQIIVNTSTSPARQRYTIAHELGHYMVEAHLGFYPTNRAAYWMLEDACQTFAAEVLSPLALVQELLAAASQSPAGLLDTIPALINRTDLSLEAAARRVIEGADWQAGIFALELSLDRADGAEPRGAAIRWGHMSSPWIEAGRGKKLGPRHALWPATVVGRGLRIGGRATAVLEGARGVVVERRSPGLVLAAVNLGPAPSTD